MAKILITTIQVNSVPNLIVTCGGGNTNSAESSLLKFWPLTYHHSHFLAATLDFASFFTMAFLGAALIFYSLTILIYTILQIGFVNFNLLILLL